jgi:hypothetical protein
MPSTVGIVLSLGVALFARGVGFDRDRSFYPTVLLVIASYYALFAVMSGSTHALITESIVMVGFLVAAVMGFKSSRWIVVAGFLAHGALDTFHGMVIANPGVPSWWPAFCFAYDVGAAAGIALFAKALTRGRTEELRVM